MKLMSKLFKVVLCSIFLHTVCAMAFADGFKDMTSDSIPKRAARKPTFRNSSPFLTWHTSKADAVAIAKQEGKDILLLAGRESCGYTSYMRNTVCETTSPPIRCLIEQNFVPWFSDVDAKTEHYSYSSGLGSYTLPLICIIDPDDPDNFVDRTTGTQTSDEFYARLKDRTGQDCQTATISGFVTGPDGKGVSGVMLSFSNNGGVATTDANGYYSQDVVTGWSGAVKPYKIGYAFNPESRSYSDQESGLNDQNYSANAFEQDYILEIYRTGRVAGLLMPSQEYDAWNGVESPDYAKDHKKITNFLYSRFKDVFDFIFLISNNDDYPPNIPYAGNSQSVSNNVEGIGKSIFDSTSLFGSSGRLRSVIHLPHRNGLENGPSLHEILHAWSSYILETSYPGHWGFSSAGGQHGGFSRETLVEIENGVYQANNGKEESTYFGENANGGNSLPFSDIELYLMGLIDKTQVPSIMVANDPAWVDPYQPGTFTASGFTEYSIEDIIQQNGARRPSVSGSQKNFKAIAVILSSSPITEQEWVDVDQDVQFLSFEGEDGDYLYNFWEATRGLATLEMDNLNSSLLDAQWIQGDVNNDKVVDLVDAIISLRALAGIAITDVYVETDVNNDQKIGLEEVVYALIETSKR